MRSSTLSTKARLTIAGLTVACALAGTASAFAQSGGTTPGGTEPAPSPTPAPTGPPAKAKLTKAGIAATYARRYGALPGRRAVLLTNNDSGYDCSGAVSYVLHAAGLLTSPMPSGSFVNGWGVPGKGQWITVYANAGHMYAVIAGLRWDTSAVGEKLNQGSGPRWRKPLGYTQKYSPGL